MPVLTRIERWRSMETVNDTGWSDSTFKTDEDFMFGDNVMMDTAGLLVHPKHRNDPVIGSANRQITKGEMVQYRADAITKDIVGHGVTMCIQDQEPLKMVSQDNKPLTNECEMFELPIIEYRPQEQE